MDEIFTLYQLSIVTFKYLLFYLIVLQIVRHMEKSLMGRLPSCDNVIPKGYGEVHY